MATFPGTTAVPGTLSPADKQKIDDISQGGSVLSIVWFPLIPQPGSSGTPSDASSTGAAYEVRAKFLFNFDRLNIPNTTLAGKMYARGMVNANDGDVRLFNATDGQELGVINFTELVLTNKEVVLTNIPASGTKLVEYQMRRNAGGTTITAEAASCDFILSS